MFILYQDDNQKSNLTDSIVDGVSIERTKNPVWARVFLDNILHANVTERDEHLRFGRFTGRIVYDEMKAHIEIEDHKPEALKYYINKFTLHDTQVLLCFFNPDLGNSEFNCPSNSSCR